MQHFDHKGTNVLEELTATIMRTTLFNYPDNGGGMKFQKAGTYTDIPIYTG
jgi:hypothetical protein